MGDVVKIGTFGLVDGDTLFGGTNETGLMGTGQFQGQKYNVDRSAFDPTKLASYGQEQAARAQQNQFIQMLQNQAQGIGPSLAQQQLQQGTNRGIAQQMGVAASQRGVNPAMAARMAMQNTAGINQQGAADAAMIREQEKMNAMGQLGAQIGSLRQGDLAATDRDLSAKMGREQLGVQQQTGINQTNASAFEGAAGRRAGLIGGFGGALASLSDENNKTEVEDGKSKAKKFLDSVSQNMSNSAAQSTNPKSYQAGQSIGKGIGAMLGLGKDDKGPKSDGPFSPSIMTKVASSASDENKKKNVESGAKKSEGFLNAMRSALGRPTVDEKSEKEKEGQSLGERIGNSIFNVKKANAAQSTSDENKKTKKGSGNGELQGFLDAIGAHSYEYKDEMKDNPLGGEGEFVSPMAQELEKTEVGKSMVIDTPDGKVVDYGKGFGAILAAQAMLNDRLNKIEKRKGG